jgi:TPR repeat protein
VRAAYIAALEEKGQKESDATGYVAAINGKVVSANVYPSNGLFRKMWAKQLAAAATEAIGERSRATAVAAPSADAVQAFLIAAEKGSAQGRDTVANMFQETRDSAGALYNETRGPSGRWLHKNYLAK